MIPPEFNSVIALRNRLEAIAEEARKIRDRLRASSEFHPGSEPRTSEQMSQPATERERLTRLEEIAREAQRIRDRLHELSPS